MLTILYGAFVFLMIFLPIVFAVGLRRISAAPWLLFGAGCLTFAASQAVHLPLNEWLADIGILSQAAPADSTVLRIALVAGLTAGVCEELARAAGYAVIRRLRPDWMRLPDAVMLGLGHGGFESMVFGGVLTAATVSALLPLIGADLTSLNLQPDQLQTLRAQLDSLAAHPWNGAYAVLERLIAMSAHIVFSMMVWKAFAGNRLRRDWYYVPLAVLYHAAVDFAAVYGAYSIRNQPLLMELSFAAMLVPGCAWVAWQIRRLRKTESGASPAAGTIRSGLRAEWAEWWTATKKEIYQLWKTGRFLVTGAVFLVFGLGSPLIAKLIPDLFRSMEGMEQFADLIPAPSAADAMAQYVKNISQFGFLLAVLLGMGAVVGEKERGVAPMILSKPMPRWAFLAGKFTAQSAMYLVCFILSAAGALYYTAILFRPPQMESYLLMNFLLWVWMLTFVALALLGSVAGKSTAAAGGIGFGLSVALMLSASIPKYGTLLPYSLLGWADQAGKAAAGVSLAPSAANGGALASAVALIVLAIVVSLGVFEQQEL